MLAATGEYTSKVLDLMGGYFFQDSRTEKRIADRHNTELNRLENTRYAYGIFKTFTNVFNGCVMYLLNIGAFVVIAVLLWNKSITAGIATATIAYIENFISPLRTLVDSASNLKSVSGITKEVLSTIKSDASERADRSTSEGTGVRNDICREKSRRFQSAIEVNNLGCRFEQFSIENFTYRFEKGKKYVITGKSGSGKSTILRMISKVISPVSGKVLIDNRELSYEEERELIFYLTQDAHIFCENFADNTSMFGAYAKTDNIVSAVGNEKYKYLSDTLVCSTLSGGEKEIIGIERALSSEKPILLLDEPEEINVDRTIHFKCREC